MSKRLTFDEMFDRAHKFLVYFVVLFLGGAFLIAGGLGITVGREVPIVSILLKIVAILGAICIPVSFICLVNFFRWERKQIG